MESGTRNLIASGAQRRGSGQWTQLSAELQSGQELAASAQEARLRKGRWISVQNGYLLLATVLVVDPELRLLPERRMSLQPRLTLYWYGSQSRAAGPLQPGNPVGRPASEDLVGRPPWFMNCLPRPQGKS